MQHSSHAALESNINVTPLVDVCLVLLKGEPVSEAQRQLAITVKDDGTVYLDATVVRADQVVSELERMHGEGPERSVAVRADQRVAYGEVLKVLDACRGVGYNDVRLMSQYPSAGR